MNRILAHYLVKQLTFSACRNRPVTAAAITKALSMYASGMGAKSGEGVHRVIDMRSDTVTQPTQEMRQFMAAAEVGDDVFGDDPTVNSLQEKAAKLMRKETAIFVPSGSMGNLISMMAHCPHRGDELIAGDMSHIVQWEQGSASQFGGVHSRQVRTNPDGTLDLDEIKSKIHDGSDSHYTHTKVICLESSHNATGGTVLSLEYMKKGLGAPVGSVVVGTTEFVSRCYRLRKALGGGMRQAGVLAAAGIYALDNIAPKLSQDHENARALAKGLQELQGIDIDLSTVHTNLVYFKVTHPTLTAADIAKQMGTAITAPDDKEGQIIRILAVERMKIRAVIHHQVLAEDAQIFLKKLRYILEKS
ncbi:low-specificity L-threonine aldolase 1 isoform X2 [Nematostella vectensis]|uniref:low-specificity L-threonine aldolase 1 isoform X2 n=1 Tax=Nematostella vectensis TaxID=45351 RepID=UPI00139018D9|nr:low-specificity L-threonine aldolase 1 isoform X2 [Nematostella vectensis]